MLGEEKFSPTLCFVALPVYLAAVKSANIPAAYPYTGAFICIVHLTCAYALCFCCLWPFSKAETLENEFLMNFQPP